MNATQESDAHYVISLDHMHFTFQLTRRSFGQMIATS